jgi:hypothetical protein
VATAEVTPRPLDKSVPVVDAHAIRPEHIKRFKMLDVEYCVPWLSTLSIDRSGADARLDADTLATFSPAPWRKGQPNPDWKRVVFIEAIVPRAGWGFPDLLKQRTGKDLSELTDGDLSTVDDIAAVVEVEQNSRGSSMREKDFIVRTNRTVALVRWRGGQLRVTYAIADGIIGAVTVSDEYLARLPSLIKAAQGFWRQCS